MATNAQIKAYIQKLVREEVERIAPKLIRETLARSLGQLIIEASDLHEIEHPSAPVATMAPSAPRGNTAKRVALSESAIAEEYPTMTGRPFTSARMTEVSTRNLTKERGIVPPSGNELITAPAITEGGTVIPVDPSTLPDHLLKAFNHDYRNLMKTYLKDGGGAS